MVGTFARVRPTRLSGYLVIAFFLLGGSAAWSMPGCSPATTCAVSCTAGPGGFASCAGAGASCEVCNPAFGTTGECSDCISYGFNIAECTNTDNTGGTCSWDGTCCQPGSAPAPELPEGAFWYFVAALTLLVLAVQTKAGALKGKTPS